MDLSSRILKSIKGTTRRILDKVDPQARIHKQKWDAQAREAQRIEKIRARVRKYFEDGYHLKFQRFVGDGSHGGTGVFAVRDPNKTGSGSNPGSSGSSGSGRSRSSLRSLMGLGRSGSGSRDRNDDVTGDKLIVKFSLGTNHHGDDSDEHLRNEKRWLKYLGGAEHFIRVRDIEELRVTKEQREASAKEKKKRKQRGKGQGKEKEQQGEPGYGWVPAVPPKDPPLSKKKNDGSGGGSGGGDGRGNNTAVAGPSGAGGAAAASGSGSGSGDNSADKQPYEDDDDGGGGGGFVDFAQLLGESPDEDEDENSGAAIPSLILEYLPHGDLESLRERLVAHGKPVPNRILWGFALCFVRMCIGMAFYKQMKPGIREEIQPHLRPSTLTHNSIKPPNVLIDMLVPGDLDHSMVPRLKMIDFGRTALKHHEFNGYADGIGAWTNLFYMGSIIQTLACLDEPLLDGYSWIPYDDAWEWRNGDGGAVLLATSANVDFCGNSRIDRALRWFVARLMSVVLDRRAHPQRRPTLEDALETCLESYRKDPWEMFPKGVPPGETDERVQAFVREAILDALPPPVMTLPATDYVPPPI